MGSILSPANDVWYVLRNLLAIVALPLTAAVVMPLWIARRFAVRLTLPDSAAGWLLAAAGLVALAGGFVLFAASLRNFFMYGQGTLAPWDPPRRLVVRGPYRYVRNPMISGVLLVLIGIALIARSVPHAYWAAGFLAVNAIYIPLLEEPVLAYRFGADYDTYRRLVPRFVPRKPIPTLRSAHEDDGGIGQRDAGARAGDHADGTDRTGRSVPGHSDRRR